MGQLILSRAMQHPSLVQVQTGGQLMSADVLKLHIPSRFSVLGDVQINQHGVVGLVLLDSRPSYRCVSYSNSEWTGVRLDPKIAIDHDDRYRDPIRRAHMVDTELGFSLIRWFIHPHAVAEFYRQDKFLGNPIVNKCQSDEDLIPEDFDEELAVATWNPCLEALPLIKGIARHLSAEIPGLLPNWDAGINPYYWCYISFHSWCMLQEVGQVALASIPKALANLEILPNRAFKQEGQLAIWDEKLLPALPE